MAHPTQAAFDAGIGFDFDADAARSRVASVAIADFEITVHDDLTAVEADWRAFEARADLTVFQTFDWLATWQRHIGARSGVTPAVVVVRQRGEIVCIWPLAIERSGRACRAKWLGASLCNYNGPLLAVDFPARLDAAAVVELWQAIKRKFCSDLGADLFDLDKMPEQIGAQATPMLALPVTRFHSDAYLMRLGTDWETFYAEKRSAKTRKTERKKRNRLAEHGQISFVTAVERSDIERSLDVMIEQKARSYAALGVANMFERPGHREFFVDFASGPRSGQLAHVSRLDIGSLAAAANFALVFRGRYYYVLASYHDGEVARFGPGNAHLHDQIQYAIERGLKEFDFTIGDEPYKRDWYDTELKLYDLIAPLTLRGYLAAAPVMAVRRLKGFILRHPKIWSVVRKARAMLGALRRRPANEAKA